MTTNIELISMGKQLDVPNLNVCMRDELSNIPTCLPISIIVNLEDKTKNGSHWLLGFADNQQKVAYSSFGDSIPNELQDFLMKIDNRPILTSDFQLQKFNEINCGERCILTLYLLNKGFKFENIILSFL